MNRTSRLTTSLGVIVLAGAAALAACSCWDEGDDAGLGCADDKQYFESEVWTKVLVGKTCIGCPTPTARPEHPHGALDDPAASRKLETVRAFARRQGAVAQAQRAAGSHGGERSSRPARRPQISPASSNAKRPLHDAPSPRSR